MARLVKWHLIRSNWLVDTLAPPGLLLVPLALPPPLPSLGTALPSCLLSLPCFPCFVLPSLPLPSLAFPPLARPFLPACFPFLAFPALFFLAFPFPALPFLPWHGPSFLPAFPSLLSLLCSS